MRAHDEEQSVVDGTDLVPGLLALLHQTLESPPPADAIDDDQEQ
jgi:hypothetical protein